MMKSDELGLNDKQKKGYVMRAWKNALVKTYIVELTYMGDIYTYIGLKIDRQGSCDLVHTRIEG